LAIDQRLKGGVNMRVVSQNSYSRVLAKYRRYLFHSDVVIVFSATLITYSFRFQGLRDIAHKSLTNSLLVFSLPIFWLFSLQACKAWNFSRVENLRKSLHSVLQASWRATLFLGFTSYLLHDAISRLWVILSSTLIVVVLGLTRLIVEMLLDREHTSLPETYLYVARDPNDLILEMVPTRRENSGAAVNYLWVAPPDRTDYEEWLNSIENRIQEESIDGIIITSSANVDSDILMRISKFYYLGITGIKLYTPLAPELSQFTPVPHVNWVRIEEPQIVNSGYAVKRLFDVIFSLLILILLSPLLLLISIAIKLTSSGPVLYTAQRMGARGKYFDFLKFRTMVQDADKLRSSVIGVPDENIADRYKLDPRITKFGRFLRRWSLDELPQLWCVLVGTMSVVGPRPILEDEYHLVSSQSRFRSIATPGLTGLWQVSGRKEVGWQERMDMDTYYIQSWSFWHDMVLILRTFAAIISGHGSY